MPDPISVQIDGPTQLADALGRLAAGLDDAFRAQMLDQATMIVRDAQGSVPRLTGAARATFGAEVLEGEATIVAGGSSAPYVPWLEYGGRVGRHKSVNRPFVKDGRYIGRAVDAAMGDIEAAAVRALEDAGRAAGIEVDGGT